MFRQTSPLQFDPSFSPTMECQRTQFLQNHHYQEDWDDGWYDNNHVHDQQQNYGYDPDYDYSPSPLPMDFVQYSCTCCGSPCHPKENCPEYWERGEEIRRKMYLACVNNGEEPYPDTIPTSGYQECYQSTRDYSFEQVGDCNRYWEEYNNHQYSYPVYGDFNRGNQGGYYEYSNQHSYYSRGYNQNYYQAYQQISEKIASPITNQQGGSSSIFDPENQRTATMEGQENQFHMNHNAYMYPPQPQFNIPSPLMDGPYGYGVPNNEYNQYYPTQQHGYYQQDYPQQAPQCGNQQEGNQQSGAFQDSKSFMSDECREMLREMKKENEMYDKVLNALTKQVGQIAEELARRNLGTLPSETKVNQEHQGSSSTNAQVHENKGDSSSPFVEGVVEDVDENEESEDEEAPIITEPVLKSNAENVLNIKTTKETPFSETLVKPENFKKLKRGPQQDELWEVCKQVKINPPLLDATKQVPLYDKYSKELCIQERQQKLPKKFDVNIQVSAILSGLFPPKLQAPGTPLIYIQIGDFKSKRALLDLGANTNILPGSLCDQLDFGPIQKVNTTVVLADLTFKLPRGVLTVYYPVDFLLLNYISGVHRVDRDHMQVMLVVGEFEEVKAKKPPDKEEVDSPPMQVCSAVEALLFGPPGTYVEDPPRYAKPKCGEKFGGKHVIRPP